MVNLTKFGDSAVKFIFQESDHYLYGNGEIEIPVNSLMLVVDESNMVTFKKLTGDPFIVFNPENSNLGTKEAVIEFYKNNMVGESGGGGTGSGVTSGQVQSMIDDSLTDYYDKDEVDAGFSDVNTALAGKQDVSGMTAYTTNHDFAAHSGNTSMHTTAQEKAAWNAKVDASALATVNNALTAHTADTSIHVSLNEKAAWNAKANIVELTQEQYNSLATKDPNVLYVITDAQAINMNDYWTSAQTSSAITQAVSGYQPITGMSAYTQQSDFAAHSGNTGIHTTTAEKAVWNGKQDALVSGTNIKTINNQSLLGSGNINISGGSGSYQYYSENTETKSANIHIEDTDEQTSGNLGVDGSSAMMFASGTETDVEETIVLNTGINVNPWEASMSYDKSIDDETTTNSYVSVGETVGLGVQSDIDPQPYSHLDVHKGDISLEVMSDEDHITTFAVSNSAVTINGDNVVTENQLAGYQPVLSAGTGIDITNNVISATGGGGATYSAGTNISIDTANTISCTIPLIVTGSSTIKQSADTSISTPCNTSAVFGTYNNISMQNLSNIFIAGNNNVASNDCQAVFGKFNKNNRSASSFGHSGNTLFAVGNGAYHAEHNAFEIRQNGDIYVNDGTNDVKLQDTITGTAANTTALGGLSFVKLTQAQYDNLSTKDSSTVYFIIDNGS